MLQTPARKEAAQPPLCIITQKQLTGSLCGSLLMPAEEGSINPLVPTKTSAWSFTEASNMKPNLWQILSACK